MPQIIGGSGCSLVYHRVVFESSMQFYACLCYPDGVKTIVTESSSQAIAIAHSHGGNYAVSDLSHTMANISLAFEQLVAMLPSNCKRVAIGGSFRYHGWEMRRSRGSIVAYMTFKRRRFVLQKASRHIILSCFVKKSPMLSCLADYICHFESRDGILSYEVRLR